MPSFRKALPQLRGGLFLGIAGIETTLVFHEGLRLPEFAAFDALKYAEGEAAILKCYRSYASIANIFGTGLILDSATWRANPDWGRKLGYTPRGLSDANRKAIELLEHIRDEYGTESTEVVISGVVGTRGDGYSPTLKMSEAEAERYHGEQIGIFSETAADMVTGYTLNYVEEAVGMVRAAAGVRIPIVMSFTVETDGKLPSGQALGAVIEEVDGATSRYPSYYMINCAHPTHFDQVLAGEEPWLERLRGLRVNASQRSHAELNESPSLDTGDPVQLGGQVADLRKRLAQINVLAGCCGTDHRHIEQIAKASVSLARQ